MSYMYGIAPHHIPHQYFAMTRLVFLIRFSTKGASFGQSSKTASGSAQHDVALSAADDRLCVGVDGRDLQATWAFDIHEEGVRRLDKLFQLVLFFSPRREEGSKYRDPFFAEKRVIK